MTAVNPMRLALSHYLRTLRERDEFDRLLPELLTQMGYLPLVKPKAGVRQFGVDFPAAGRSPVDGVDELLLFVIKQGDIGRRTWSGDPNAVRESMDEIIDVWLASHVPPEYQGHRKVIVVATTGDLGQEVQPNWTGYAARHPTAAGRVYAAYGGVYIGVAILWLWLVDRVTPSASDWIGVAVCFLGMAIIMFGPKAQA